MLLDEQLFKLLQLNKLFFSCNKLDFNPTNTYSILFGVKLA